MDLPITVQDPGDGELERYAARTRRSLILRLADWQDQRSWDEFYRTYWRLIYAVAIKAGLHDDEAWDVVQETVLTIAKQSRKGLYDPGRGSFKLWLWKVTSWRINDRFRQHRKEHRFGADDEAADPPLSVLEDASSASFEEIWEKEWQQNLVKAALERVKAKVSPKQYQIFYYLVVKEMESSKVRQMLGVSIAGIYLAKHRVSSLLRKEIEELRERGERPLPAAPPQST